MVKTPANVFIDIPAVLPAELVATLLASADVRIERIVSLGHRSPDGFWYDQIQNEWVLVLRGSAVVRFQDEPEPVRLEAGDYVDITAHRKHRVEWTTPDEPTIWLAVHYGVRPDVDGEAQKLRFVIRPESGDDSEAIQRVHSLAFGQEDEARLVDQLRRGGHTVLSLVAELSGQVVGHVLFSRLEIRSAESITAAVALAPLAVLPEFQHKGVGAALVQAGLEQAPQTGHGIVIVVGEPAYYSRFGFSAERAAKLKSKYAGPAFMALELRPDALKNVHGEVHYPAPFDDL